VVEWINSQPDCSRQQKIGALELLGASHAAIIDIEDIEYPSEGQSEGENDEEDNTSIQHGYQLILRPMKPGAFQPSYYHKAKHEAPFSCL